MKSLLVIKFGIHVNLPIFIIHCDLMYVLVNYSLYFLTGEGGYYTPLKPLYQVVYENEEVTLHCNSQLNPEWYIDGKPLPPSKYTFLADPNSITLHSLKLGDSGLYTCVGLYENAAGMFEKFDSVALNLFVAGKRSNVFRIRCNVLLLFYSESC